METLQENPDGTSLGGWKPVPIKCHNLKN